VRAPRTFRGLSFLSVGDVFTELWWASSTKWAEPMYGVDSDRDAVSRYPYSRTEIEVQVIVTEVSATLDGHP
jgi:hypothetical protein